MQSLQPTAAHNTMSEPSTLETNIDWSALSGVDMDGLLNEVDSEEEDIEVADIDEENLPQTTTFRFNERQSKRKKIIEATTSDVEGKEIDREDHRIRPRIPTPILTAESNIPASETSSILDIPQLPPPFPIALSRLPRESPIAKTNTLASLGLIANHGQKIPTETEIKDAIEMANSMDVQFSRRTIEIGDGSARNNKGVRRRADFNGEHSPQRKRVRRSGGSNVKLTAENQKRMGEANAAFVAHDYNKAQSILLHILSLQPQCTVPYHTLILIYSELGMKLQAMYCLFIVAELTTTDMSLWKRAGELAFECEKWRETAYAYGKYLRTFQQDYSAMYHRGYALVKIDKPKIACRLLENVYNHDPENSDSYLKELCQCFHELRLPRKAIICLERYWNRIQFNGTNSSRGTIHNSIPIEDIDLNLINYLCEFYMETQKYNKITNVIKTWLRSTELTHGAFPIDLEVKYGIALLHTSTIEEAEQYFHALMDQMDIEDAKNDVDDTDGTDHTVTEYFDLYRDVAYHYLNVGAYVKALRFYEFLITKVECLSDVYIRYSECVTKLVEEEKLNGDEVDHTAINSSGNNTIVSSAAGGNSQYERHLQIAIMFLEHVFAEKTKSKHQFQSLHLRLLMAKIYKFLYQDEKAIHVLNSEGLYKVTPKLLKILSGNQINLLAQRCELLYHTKRYQEVVDCAYDIIQFTQNIIMTTLPPEPSDNKNKNNQKSGDSEHTQAATEEKTNVANTNTVQNNSNKFQHDEEHDSDESENHEDYDNDDEEDDIPNIASLSQDSNITEDNAPIDPTAVGTSLKKLKPRRPPQFYARRLLMQPQLYRSIFIPLCYALIELHRYHDSFSLLVHMEKILQTRSTRENEPYVTWIKEIRKLLSRSAFLSQRYQTAYIYLRSCTYDELHDFGTIQLIREILGKIDWDKTIIRSIQRRLVPRASASIPLNMLLAEYHLRRLAYKKAQGHYQIALNSADSICKLGNVGVPKGQNPIEYLKICKFHSKILNLKLATVKAHLAVDKGQIQKTSTNPESMKHLLHSLAHISQYVSNNDIMDPTELTLNMARYLDVCNFKPLTYSMYQKTLTFSMNLNLSNTINYNSAAPSVSKNRDEAVERLSNIYENNGADELARRLREQYSSQQNHSNSQFQQSSQNNVQE